MFNKFFFKMSLILAVGAFSASCDKAENSVARFNLDKVRIDIISTGQTSSGELPTVSVLASNGYTATSDSDWLTVDKPQGSGKTDVTILAGRYDSGTGRTGHIVFTSEGISQTVTVTQTATPFPAFGYVYLDEDFSWITRYATALEAGDYIGSGDYSAKAPNVGSMSQGDNPNPDAVAFMEEFAERGYSVMKPEDRTMYLQTHYLKFGRTDHNNGLKLPLLDLRETGEESTDIELSFDFAGHMSSYLYIDKINMVVEVLSGEGEILKASGEFAKVSDIFLSSQKDGETKWTRAVVKIKGVTSSTVLVIRHLDLEEKGAHRFYLDNIKAVKVPVK